MDVNYYSCCYWKPIVIMYQVRTVDSGFDSSTAFELWRINAQKENVEAENRGELVEVVK